MADSQVAEVVHHYEEVPPQNNLVVSNLQQTLRKHMKLATHTYTFWTKSSGESRYSLCFCMHWPCKINILKWTILWPQIESSMLLLTKYPSWEIFPQVGAEPIKKLGYSWWRFLITTTFKIQESGSHGATSGGSSEPQDSHTSSGGLSQDREVARAAAADSSAVDKEDSLHSKGIKIIATWKMTDSFCLQVSAPTVVLPLQSSSKER